MKTVIGIDVSKQSVDVAFSHGKRYKWAHYPHNDKTTASTILADLPTRDVHVVLEATGSYSHQLATSFYQEGIAISMVNPLSIKFFGKMRFQRAKTDRADARLICQYGQAEHPALWKPRPPEQEQLRQIVKVLEDFQMMRTEITNRQEAAKPLPVKSLACQEALQSLLDSLDDQIASLQVDMQRLAKQVAGETYRLLNTIKGIGEITASALIALCGSFEEFQTAAQLVAFAGLNPSPYQSGTSVRGRGGISKRGHGTLRRLLYMGALTAMRFNPSCQALYERLVAKGKSKKVARIAVAHKLLRIAFGVVKSGKPFDPHYSST